MRWMLKYSKIFGSSSFLSNERRISISSSICRITPSVFEIEIARQAPRDAATVSIGLGLPPPKETVPLGVSARYDAGPVFFKSKPGVWHTESKLVLAGWDDKIASIVD